MNEDDSKQFRFAKLQQNVTLRRGTVYRYLSSSLQLLMLGNAGGIGFVIGFFRTGTEPPMAHLLSIVSVIFFLFGILFSAGSVICVASLAMKEAHDAERSLINIVYNKITYEEAVLNLEQRPPGAAAGAMLFGLASISCLILGAIIGMILIVSYF